MELSLLLVTRVMFSLALVILIAYIINLYKNTILKSQRIKRRLHMQGVKGPPPSFLYGNIPEMKQIQLKTVKANNHGEIVSHDYGAFLFPYFEHWRKEYGTVYTYSTGFRQHLYVNDPELVKEMNQCITLDLGKPSYLTKRLDPVFGNGIVRANGHFWAQQRKIIAPELFMDKVKGMVGLLVDAAQPLLRKWENYIEEVGGSEADIRIDGELREFTADVLAKTCFGSSYSNGKQIFSKLRSLQQIIAQDSLLFGIRSFGHNKNRKRIDELTRELETLIWETVQERQGQSSSIENDLMQSILEEATNDSHLGNASAKRFIVDNCKNIYLAGHETTANTTSWCMMLLALHPEWQSRIREESKMFCNDGLVDANSLSKMKTVTMVIQETLRLYPPAAFVSREALEEVQIGNISVPKGVCIWTLIPTLHRDQNIWGTDANEFKPERFSDGVSKACKYQQAYIPFGLGNRLCLGRNFAMIQLKIVLSLTVSKFAFFLSPNYIHSPAYKLLVEPEHGVQVVIRKVS